MRPPTYASDLFPPRHDWRGLLSGSVTEGRQLLREVLEAPLKFEPDGKTYRFSAPVATGKLIADTVLPAVSYVPTNVASPMPASWNGVVPWLRAVDELRRAA